MGSFSKAIQNMSGESAGNATFSSDDVVDIINASIQLMESGNRTDAANKLIQLRSAVRSGDYTRDILESTTGCSITFSESDGCRELNEMQLLRFRLEHPVAFLEYKEGNNRPYVQGVINQLLEKYPAPPNSSIVYVSARKSQEYWNNYLSSSWRTVEYGDGVSYAWIYANACVHLLRFVKNIFTSGIILRSKWHDDLAILYSDGLPVHINDENINFKAVMVDGHCELFVDDVKLMEISSRMLGSICGLMNTGNNPTSWTLEQIREGLVRGGEK